jgi:hypothetical protein
MKICQCVRIYEIHYTITYGIFFLSSTIMFLPVTWNPLHSHVTNHFTWKQKKSIERQKHQNMAYIYV